MYSNYYTIATDLITCVATYVSLTVLSVKQQYMCYFEYYVLKYYGFVTITYC